MARVCEICKKEYLKANHVAKGIGQRVTKRTMRTQKPNLRMKRISIDGTKVRVRLCASCLKRIKFEKNQDKTVVNNAQNVVEAVTTPETN